MVQIKLDRFKGIEKHEFTLEILTPMFLGGANPQDAELRAASIKGALRFWWRALQAETNINDLRRRENEIFGGSEGDSGQKSRVKIEVETDLKPVLEDLPKGTTYPVKHFNLGIIHYLSYGLYEYQRGAGNVYVKKHFKPGKSFKIILFLSGLSDDDNKKEVLKAFKALIRFGGLGAKSRNGFGSLNLVNSNPKLNDFPENFQNDLVKYTAFSRESRLFVFSEHNSWQDALSEIGMTYRNARLSLEKKHTFYKRGYLGRPIEAKFEKIPNFIRNGRHTKPYFLHVSKTQSGKYQGQILYLPYRFYEENKHNDFMKVCEEFNKNLGVEAKNVKVI